MERTSISTFIITVFQSHSDLSHTDTHSYCESVTDRQTDGHRAAYQRSRGDVAFGAGDYAVSRAVCLGLCKETQSAELVLSNNGERSHLLVVKWVVTV